MLHCQPRFLRSINGRGGGGVSLPDVHPDHFQTRIVSSVTTAPDCCLTALESFWIGLCSAQTGRGLLDVLLVALCVCLLLALGIVLRPLRAATAATAASTVPDPDVPADEGPRERLMSLGIALLLVSLAVCLYTMYRLGFCCNRREYNRGRLRSGIPSVNSRLHLISGTDLPPTYDAIMVTAGRDLQPPPYFAIIAFHDEKLPPAYAPRSHAAGAGVGGTPSSEASASRPQEAG
ncbi:hypothetical protein ONE63_009162 [Megalurothrips usitatus]|uniref:Uncharacterized protein n=1 Tax=Megalurothrips usitatus TaxID=439358 RepID=A0AAV7XQM3_9NEOP|nr:hypothetical protein ONE63_009162 [Megalurothrips usitatus]